MKIKTPAITTYLLLCCTVCAYASEHGAGQETASWEGFFWSVVNFLILAGLIYYYGRKPIGEFLTARSKAIEKTLQDAAQAREMARQALAEAQRRFQEKDKEVNEIIQAAIRAGEMERDEALEDGRRKKTTLLSQSQAFIDFELKKAKDEIRKEAIEAAFNYAQQELVSRLTQGQKEKLLQESLDALTRKA
ncbi:MAG TPA: ATP synthase F0 subunit B [Thermodesulfovibrionia bacterium]|nr:ATP synthase F0 subunit B [Thermodesulfovibrionia bacterium]